MSKRIRDIRPIQRKSSVKSAHPGPAVDRDGAGLLLGYTSYFQEDVLPQLRHSLGHYGRFGSSLPGMVCS